MLLFFLANAYLKAVWRQVCVSSGKEPKFWVYCATFSACDRYSQCFGSHEAVWLYWQWLSTVVTNWNALVRFQKQLLFKKTCYKFLGNLGQSWFGSHVGRKCLKRDDKFLGRSSDGKFWDVKEYICCANICSALKACRIKSVFNPGFHTVREYKYEVHKMYCWF